MTGLLMALFAINGHERTGFIACVTFRKGFAAALHQHGGIPNDGTFASFLVPTPFRFSVGTPLGPRQEKKGNVFLQMSAMCTHSFTWFYGKPMIFF